jgi:hypothetical protein
MRPRPMNPHVACRFCELEKHLLGCCQAEGEAAFLREAKIDIAPILDSIGADGVFLMRRIADVSSCRWVEMDSADGADAQPRS